MWLWAARFLLWLKAHSVTYVPFSANLYENVVRFGSDY
jgi:hypothetical protein